MKNGYEGISNSQLISRFTEDDGEYFVEFLDGAYYKVPMNAKNKQELLDIMMEQAVERNNSNALKKAKSKRAKAVLAICAEAIVATASVLVSQRSDNDIAKIVSTIVGSVAGIGIIVNGIKYSIDKSEIDELRKYAIFIKIKDRLEECVDPNLFNGVGEKADVLNINTLDNYTLRDLQIIKENLDRSSKLYSHFDMEYSPSKR